jgi:ribosomal protein L17
LSSQSKFANRIDQLANDIVTKAMKDDIANNNLRKGVQIQGLVNDLALGIVETVLAKNDNQKPKSSHQKKNLTKKKQHNYLMHKPSKPTGPSADIMLQKALYRQKQVKKQSDKKIDDLAENLVSRINERQSGSSRMDSGRSHESEVEKLLKGVHDGLPEALNVTPSPRSGESEMAEGLIPTQVGISPRSNTTGSSFGGKMLDQLVKGSIIDGQMSTKSGASSIAEDLVAQSMKYGIKSSTLTEGSELVENLLDETLIGAAANTKSDQSSVAENLIQQAYDNAQQSTVSTGESYIEKMVAKSIIDNAATTLSTKSSFAEKIVAAGFKEGEKQALSKSPCSSVAEDIVRNLSGIASSKSEASHLAEDLLEHVQDDLNPRSLVKSAGTSKSAGTNLASDIANSILRGLDKDQEEKTGSKMELPASNVNLMKKQQNQVPESKTVSKSSLPKSKISLRPTSGQKSKTGSKMSLPKSKMSLNKQ